MTMRGIYSILDPGKLLLLQGLKDYIVVDSDDVLLIVKKGGRAEYQAIS